MRRGAFGVLHVGGALVHVWRISWYLRFRDLEIRSIVGVQVHI